MILFVLVANFTLHIYIKYTNKMTVWLHIKTAGLPKSWFCCSQVFLEATIDIERLRISLDEKFRPSFRAKVLLFGRV